MARAVHREEIENQEAALPALEAEVLNRLLHSDEDASATLQEQIALLHSLRAAGDTSSQQIDRHLLDELRRQRRGLAEATACQTELRELLRKVTSPPLHPAIFLGAARTDDGDFAVVQLGNSRSVVMVSDDVDLEELEIGAEVLLSSQRNAVVGRPLCPIYESGELARFERNTDDGRLVLAVRDEEWVVRASAALGAVTLQNGDYVRWDRNAWMAFERIERPRGEHLFFETPSEGFETIGGLEPQIAKLRNLIRLLVDHGVKALEYGLDANRGAILHGPVGNGKTMLGRAVAHELGGRFMSVKPSSWANMWFGESERRIRELFRVAREAAAADPRPIVMFFDELDTFAPRGKSANHVDDKVLNAFLVEIDGMESRGNVLIIGATNRRDALDEALLRPGRFGDLQIDVPRPNSRAARNIFAKHLRPQLPYAGGVAGADPMAAREALIDSAVSYLYAPNGCGSVATLTFRDGKTQRVEARELMSGARIAQIARAALETACLREIDSGARGVRVEDVLEAAAESIEAAAGVLTPKNCTRHLELPQDVDVVRIDRAPGPVPRTHRYLRVA